MAALARGAWRSLTPEPERELPPVIAAMRAGGPPSEEHVAMERALAERLVLRGSRRQWMRWLDEATALVERAEEDALSSRAVSIARRVAIDVIHNHHALMLGLPGRVDRRAEEVRRRLAARQAVTAKGPSR